MEDKIYEVIEPEFFLRNLIFSRYFFEKCKDNANKAINIPIELKNNLKRKETEQGLYAQFVKLWRKYLK